METQNATSQHRLSTSLCSTHKPRHKNSFDLIGCHTCRPEEAPPPVATPTANAVQLTPLKAAARAEISAMAIPMGTCVDSNNECVVCFATILDTCLRPCGHIAMCRKCASNASECPICQHPISSVDPIPTATAAIPMDGVITMANFVE